MKRTSLVLLSVVLSACSADRKTESGAPSELPPAPVQTFQMSSSEMNNPTNPVVSVNGEILNNADLNTEIQVRLSSIGQQNITPQLASQMRQIVIDQFITRSLLLNDAKARAITATDEDLSSELAKIQQMIPEELTVDEMLDKSPLGRETMLNHIKNKIVIDKLSEAILGKEVDVAESEVDDFIEKNKADLMMPETVEARHILIKFDPSDDDNAKKAKKETIAQIRREIMEGADFAEIASKKSDCPSGQMGGSLGKFSRGRMVPEFEAAAFSQKTGVVGDIVETQFGYHIIKVDSHDKEAMFPRDQIVAKIKDIKAQTVMMKHLEDLRNKAEIKLF